MMGMAQATRHKQGTFIGDGTSSVSLQIGFEPDVIVVSAPVAWDETGWAGTGIVTIVKDLYTIMSRHSSVSGTTVGHIAYFFKTGEGSYGNAGDAPAYSFYCDYSNGTLTITNKTSANGTRFIQDYEYTWNAYKV